MVEILKVEGYNVKEPSYNYDENAGADFYVPAYNETFVKDFTKYNPTKTVETIDSADYKGYAITVQPGENVIVPSGWYTKFANDMMFMACNKSGVANKQHFSYAAHIIDASYQGILLLSVFNYGNNTELIKLDEKLLQLVQVPICKGLKVSHLTKEQFFPEETERKDGALGSTGLK